MRNTCLSPRQPHIFSPVAESQGHTHIHTSPTHQVITAPTPTLDPSDQTSPDLCRPSKPTHVNINRHYLLLRAKRPLGDGAVRLDLTQGAQRAATSSALCSPGWRGRKGWAELGWVGGGGVQRLERVMESKETQGHKEGSGEATTGDVPEQTHTGETDVQP